MRKYFLRLDLAMVKDFRHFLINLRNGVFISPSAGMEISCFFVSRQEIVLDQWQQTRGPDLLKKWMNNGFDIAADLLLCTCLKWQRQFFEKSFN
ncbi:hypothetical protein D3C86_1806720 [compost metagenome]